MSDFLDQAFPEPAPEPTEVIAEVPATEAAPVTETPTTPEEPVQAPAPETPPVPAPQQEHSIPLPKYLDERERRREAERRVAEFEARQAPSQRPDPLDDPAGYGAFLESEMETRLSQQRFQMSDIMARQAHGAETVENAVKWAQEKASADPMFAASYMRDPNPIDWIVRQHQRDALLSDIGDVSKLDDWIAREAAKRGYALPSATLVAAPIPVAAVTQPAIRPAAPPRSIASEAAATESTAGDPRAEFMAIFDRK
jgi:hypothetical protein